LERAGGGALDGADVTATGGDEGPQVAELLRVNAELAAELRALQGSRIEAPRQGRVPAARGIAKLWGERRGLEAQLEEAQAALQAARAGQEATQAALEDVQAHREGLERQNREMAAEIVRLRTGMRGAMRRARGLLLERTGLFGAR
jgi:chromosome segregation ATPase